jgi:hypothetical protein
VDYPQPDGTGKRKMNDPHKIVVFWNKPQGSAIQVVLDSDKERKMIKIRQAPSTNHKI